MENRVRDLELLHEQDTDQRKRGSLAMAALAILALAFAIGLVVGKAALPAAPERDPLDQLDHVLDVARKDSAGSMPPAAAKETEVQSAKEAAPPAVEAAQLTFERRLTEVEERPEVIAALEAASREEERMAAIHTAASPSRGPEDRGGYEFGGLDGDEDLAPQSHGAPRIVPAGVAAYNAGQKLEKSKAHDRLIAAAWAKRTGRVAARGSDGEWTLQVISYDSSAAAEAFASALRARGHEAFVSTADVEERGRYYRVRVGPFKSRVQAEDYRRAFEEQERMNTIVVRRQPPTK